jgi:hypothetical protein
MALAGAGWGGGWIMGWFIWPGDSVAQVRLDLQSSLSTQNYCFQDIYFQLFTTTIYPAKRVT